MEGIVRGNVFANDVKVKNDGMLFGDIQCFYLTLDPTASIKVRPSLRFFCCFPTFFFRKKSLKHTRHQVCMYVSTSALYDPFG